MKKASPDATRELEPPNKEQELARVVPIRTETTLTRYPVHRIAKKAVVSIRETKKNERGKVVTTWEVKHPPGPLAYKLDTLIINRRIDEMRTRGQISQLFQLGSLSEMCRELGLTVCGQNKNKIKEALEQNAGALIKAKLSYKGNDGSEREFEFTTTRYTVIFTGEKLPDGGRADAVYIELHPRFHEMLRHSKTRPLDYEYLKALAPAAQRLYELLSFAMFGTLTHGRPNAQMLYSDFCRSAPLTRYFDRTKATKQMYKLHKPHVESGYIKAVEFDETTDATGAIDWVMKYTPGRRARHEFREFTEKKLAGRREQKPRLVTAEPALKANTTEAVNQLTSKLVIEQDARLINELSRYGVGETTARQLVESRSGEVARQLEAWPYREKTGMKNPPGMLIKFIRDGEPLPPALLDAKRKADEVRQEKTKREKQEAHEKARQSHEAAHTAAFESYLTSELGKLAETNHEAYTTFESDFEKRFGRMTRNFSVERREQIRLAHWNAYAQEHPDLSVLSFWQWDAEKNPVPFRFEG
jgi:hypothetical protein